MRSEKPVVDDGEKSLSDKERKIMEPVLFTVIKLSCGLIYDVLNKNYHMEEKREKENMKKKKKSLLCMA